MSWLLMILLWPWHVVLAGCAHVDYWLRGRPWALLLPASPAILTGVGLVLILVFESSGWDTAAVQRYEEALHSALDRGDVAAAGILARKLRILDAGNADARYAAARLAELRGEPDDRPFRLMRELAPSNKAGHPRAHYWMAQRMLRGTTELSATEKVELIHHLEQSLGSHRDREDAHVLLASLQRERGNLKEAIRHLEAVVLDRPEMRVTLSSLYAETGDVYRARQQRDRAIEHFRRQADWNPNDVKSRIGWARAVALSDDFEEAEKILLGGSRGQADDGAAKNAIAETYIAWFDHTKSDRRQNVKQQLEVLDRALACDPRRKEILERLGAILERAATESDSTGFAIRELIPRSDAPATAHIVSASVAAWQDDAAAADHGLELAKGRMATAPVVVSGLVGTLASSQPPQLERAMKLADAAVKRWPNEPALRASRGDALAAQRRWSEARDDLEMALRNTDDQPRIHARLAEIHAHLGQSDLAAKHAALAKAPQEAKDSQKKETTAPAAKAGKTSDGGASQPPLQP